MKKYNLKYKPISTKPCLFKIIDRNIYFKHVLICRGDVVNEILFKAYLYSDFVYEHDLFTIEFGKVPILHKKEIEFANKDQNYDLGYENPLLELDRNVAEAETLSNNTHQNIHGHDLWQKYNVRYDNGNEKKNNNSKDTYISDMDKFIEIKGLDCSKSMNVLENGKAIFDFHEIAVFENVYQMNSIYSCNLYLHGHKYCEGITSFGLFVISDKYTFIKYQRNAIGIDLAQNISYIYKNGVEKVDISLFGDVINLFSGYYKNLDRLFTLFSLYNHEYFWKFLPKNKDLVCSLYRNTDFKRELVDFIGDFVGARANSVAQIIVFFPELERYFVETAMTTKYEFLVEDYIEYLKRNSMSTEGIEDLLLKYNSFYLFLLCRPNYRDVFKNFSDIIELEKLYIKVQRIRNKYK